jgi:transposase
MAVPSCPGCCERDARIAQLETRLAELEAKVREQAHLILDLARKLQDKDLPKADAPAQPDESAKPPPRTASQRKPGAQPGHPPHLKQLLPPERVTKIKTFVPSRCQHCQQPLPATRQPHDPQPTRFQVAELPELKPAPVHAAAK